MAGYDRGQPMGMKRRRMDDPRGGGMYGGRGPQQAPYEEEGGGRGGQMPSSPVIHIRNVPEGCSDSELVPVLSRFGGIVDVLMLNRRNQAMVEFEDIEASQRCVSFAQTRPLVLRGQNVVVAFSNSSKIMRGGEAGPGQGGPQIPTPRSVEEHGSGPPPLMGDRPHKILIMTIHNPKYPITVDVLHTICSSNGSVARIVIFKKSGVQALVEFEDVESAKRAKENLSGADIYSGCCTLDIEFSKTPRLNVFKNDTESWDYTNPNLGKEGGPPSKKPLLSIPPGPGGPGPSADGYGEPSYDAYGQQEAGGYAAPGAGGGGYDDGYGGNLEPQGGGGYGDDGNSAVFQTGYNRPAAGPASYDMPPRGGGGGYRGRGGGRGPPKEDYGGYDAAPPSRGRARGGGRGAPRGGDRGGRGSFRGRGGPRGGGHRGGPPQSQGGYDEGYGYEGGYGGEGEGGESPVLMVYNLNPDKMNATKAFNLFCLYGNVERVKFLKSKEGVAMIQMGDPFQASRAKQNLTGTQLFGKRMIVDESKQSWLQEVANPHDLKDGTPSYVDFREVRTNRFKDPNAASRNRIQPPFRTLHFFNVPPDITEEEVAKVFTESGSKAPTKLKIFKVREKSNSATGLIEWDSLQDAVEAMSQTQHTTVPNPHGEYPYTFKMCFSSAPIIERPDRPPRDGIKRDME